MSRERIRALVASNPGQASVDEYALVYDTVRASAPSNVLVFGVGRDSALWIEANEGGRTAFLESVAEWADFARREVEGIEVHDVRYWTRRFMWPVLRHVPRALRMSLPPSIEQTQWNIILVDAPRGTRWYRHGRMMSIHTAAHLAGRTGAHVFVHDCDRPTERDCADAFLGPERLIAEVESMRHYRMD